MRTFKLTPVRTDLTESQGLTFHVYEASSMGDYTQIHAFDIFDDKEIELTINDRQVIEIRPANRYV